MAAKQKFPHGAQSMAAYLAQLAHGASLGRVTINQADGRSAAMEGGAAWGNYEKYELTMRLTSRDPLPCPYGKAIDPASLDDLKTLATDALERVLTLMQKPDMQNFRWLEDTMEKLAVIAKRIEP